MTDVIKTYDEVAPMVGLALMAKRRAYKGQWETSPDRRCICPFCARYFEIIDRITRGEKP